MKSRTFAILIIAACFAGMPTLARAQTTDVVSLYTQLIALLKQELAALSAPTTATVSWEPVSGPAPFTTIFTVSGGTGTETLIFGDGTWNGSDKASCVKNKKGFCDLSKPVAHTYRFPDTYNVLVYSHVDGNAVLVASTTLTVSEFATSTTR